MIHGTTTLLGVMGWPVRHSLSPRIHNHWLTQEQRDAVYLPLPVTPENLVIVTTALPAMGFLGWNVTLPYKQAILPLVQQLTPLAKRAGAVNTVRVEDNGSLTGDNTDVAGFREPLAAFPLHADAPVVVLGSGGAARAVMLALHEEGCSNIHLVNRTLSSAHALLEELEIPATIHDWQALDGVFDGAGLVVNTTSLSHGSEPFPLLPWGRCRKGCLAYDISYGRAPTAFCQQATNAGLEALDGLPMLIVQAQHAYAFWFGSMPVMEAPLMDALRV